MPQNKGAFVRVAVAIIGVTLFFGGWALFGYGFDFLDAHMNWPAWLWMPIIVCMGGIVTAAIVSGLALVVASAKGAVGNATPSGEEER